MTQRYGIGASTQGKQASPTGNAPPVYPSNGSGGPGILGSSVSKSASGELSDLMTGRITLGLVEIGIVGLIAFYVWTRSSQGG